MRILFLLVAASILAACAEPTVRSTVTPVTGESTSEGRVRFNPAQSNPPPVITIGEKEKDREGK
jgi:hypothetical protein